MLPNEPQVPLSSHANRLVLFGKRQAGKLIIPAALIPKAAALVSIFQRHDFSPFSLPGKSGLFAISVCLVPYIDSYIGLMHTLFTLEDRFGLRISECDGEIHLKIDSASSEQAKEPMRPLTAWREQAAKLEAGEITREEYDRWRHNFPAHDFTRLWAQVLSQLLSDRLIAGLKKNKKGLTDLQKSVRPFFL